MAPTRISSTSTFRLLRLALLIVWCSCQWTHGETVADAIGCPLACQCTAGKVDCTLAGLSDWPYTLPANTTTLILTRNHLKSLPAAGLAQYPSLKTLVLSHNQIDRVDGQLQIHDQLENLDVSHNLLSGQKLETLLLSGLPKLRHLNVAFNRIESLGNDTFSQSAKLQWLSLYGNPVRSIDSGLFRRNEFLGYLSLSGLEVDALPPKLLDPLIRLQQLEIRDNPRLSALADDSFRFLGSNLRHLNLANNSLSALPRSLRQLDALRTLNLDDNPFVCDCNLFWFANWLEKRPAVTPSSNMYCAGRPLIDSLWRMHCSAVRLETSSLFQRGDYGQPIRLTCNFSGNPAPSVTWVTPDRTALRYDPTQVESLQNASVRLLSTGQLEVSHLDRSTAGDYACHASNALSNVTAFMRVNIEPKGFRRAQIQSILAGFALVAVFIVITIIVQGFRYIMDRFGLWECWYCCGKRMSPRAKQIRTLLEAIEQYKSQQLDRMRDNYHGQVQRIRENYVQQRERIHQSYSGQVKYLRGVRDYGTQQISTIREQYNDQAKRVYDYTLERLQTVQRNYVSQRAKVRKFSAHQLIRLREKYKFQQKTLNKILENLPAFYIDSCRSAACARTDSVYFQDGPDGLEVDVVESIIKQGIHLDLPEVCLEELVGEPIEMMDMSSETKEASAAVAKVKAQHGRQPSAGSLDLSFLFAPIRFPSLNWRRRNTVDEEAIPGGAVAVSAEQPEGGATALEVAVEICPIPSSASEASTVDITDDVEL